MADKKATVPEPLWQRVEQIIEDHPEYGYNYVSELVKDLLRRWADEREGYEV